MGARDTISFAVVDRLGVGDCLEIGGEGLDFRATSERQTGTRRRGSRFGTLEAIASLGVEGFGLPLVPPFPGSYLRNMPV